MTPNIHLAKCGSLVAQKIKNVDYLTCLCRILTVGEYTDMNGTKVVVDDKTLTKLVANYNNRIEDEYIKHQQLITESSAEIDPNIVNEILSVKLVDFDGLPNQIDHDTSTIRSTVGNVIGKMELRNSMGKLAIFANIKVKGPENVVCVSDNRWRNLSVQYNPSSYEWVEVSWVIYGADPDANKVMSKVAMSPPSTLSAPVHGEDNVELMKKCIAAIYGLERKIFLDKGLLALCKLRKITKADAYFIEKELNSVQELSTLNSIFNILDAKLSRPKKENFIELSKDVMRDLHNTLQGASNVRNYK